MTGRSISIYDPETGRVSAWDYLAPDPFAMALTPGALALGVESMVRFRGWTRRPITLAEHMIRVGRFAAAIAADRDGPVREALAWGLLHDAHEPLVPWGDCPAPWKTDEMRKVERRIDVVVWDSLTRWGVLPLWYVDRFEHWITADVLEVVGLADAAALHVESLLWQPGAAAAGRMPEDVDIERLLPLAEPRVGDDWLTEVRRACGSLSD